MLSTIRDSTSRAFVSVSLKRFRHQIWLPSSKVTPTLNLFTSICSLHRSVASRKWLLIILFHASRYRFARSTAVEGGGRCSSSGCPHKNPIDFIAPSGAHGTTDCSSGFRVHGPDLVIKSFIGSLSHPGHFTSWIFSIQARCMTPLSQQLRRMASLG